jgi:hypothetical protein
LQNQAETFALFLILNLARNAALVVVRHKDQIASSQANIRGNSRTLIADWPLGDLHHYLGAHRIDFRDILGGNFFAMFPSSSADLLNAAIQPRQGIPKVEKSILLKADVDKHRFQTLFDVLYFAFKDTADDVAIGVALNVIFFQNAVF